MLLYVQKNAMPFKEANWEVVAVNILHHRKERLSECREGAKNLPVTSLSPFTMNSGAL